MGADLRALGGVEDAFEQRAEDGGFDVAPVQAVDDLEGLDFFQREVDDVGVGEQAAVEVEDVIGAEVAAVGHRVEELCEQPRELAAASVAAGLRGGVDDLLKSLFEQADVFGEHAEHQLHEEMGGIVGRDAARRMPSAMAEELGGLRGDRFGGLPGLERFRVGEDAAEDVEVLRLGEAARSKAWTCLTVPVKLVWISKRSRSQTIEQRRVFEVFAVLQQLLVGGDEVFVLALVFPAEVVAHPDVGPAAAAAADAVQLASSDVECGFADAAFEVYQVPSGSAAAGLGWPRRSQRSRKCCWQARARRGWRLATCG